MKVTPRAVQTQTGLT